MFKNTAASFIVFAFDATTNVPKTGDAANITAYVSKDYGAVTVLGDTTATEMDATNAPGYYLFTAAQAETNADCLLVSAKSSTANIKVIGAPAIIYTRPTTGWLAPTTAGRTLTVDASGRALSDVDTIKTQTVTCAAGVTVRADVGAAGTPGAANGMFIAGSNAATTLATLTVSGATTLTGNVSAAAGVSITGGAQGDALKLTATTSGAGLVSVGAGTGSGISAAGAGGGTGHGILATSGSGATGDGIRAVSTATAGSGLKLTGSGIGPGLESTGGLTGSGGEFYAGANASLPGLYTEGAGTGAGAEFAGGGGGASVGLQLSPGGGGTVGISGNITGNITGNLSGSVGSLTGHTPQTGDNYARLGAPAGASVSADIAAMKVDTAAILADTGTDGVVVAAGSKSGYAIGAAGIGANAFAAGAIDAAAIAADAIGASELAQGAAQEIADEILNRDIAGGASGGSRNVRNALRSLRNKAAIAAGTLTVYQEDDTTSAWTATVATTAGDPISSIDPA